MNNRRRKMICVCVFLIMLIGILLLGAMAVLAQNDSYNVSGREISLGRECKIKGEAGTCDVKFVGWINKDQSNLVWVPIWEGEGRVEAEIDYTGKAKLEEVTLKGGRWKIVFADDQKPLSGKVEEGTISWTSYCAPNGYVDAVLSVNGPDFKGGTFKGCLDDIFPPLIPTIWGNFSFW